jgi:hypothetical protein
VLAERAPIPTLAVMLVLGVLGYVGLSNISTEFSFTDFLPEDSPVVVTLDTIEAEFGGGFGETTQVLIEDADLTDPAAFNAIARRTANLADTPDVLTVSTPIGEVASATSPVSVVQQLSFPGPDGTIAAPTFVETAVAAGYDPATGRMATTPTSSRSTRPPARPPPSSSTRSSPGRVTSRSRPSSTSTPRPARRARSSCATRSRTTSRR